MCSVNTKKHSNFIEFSDSHSFANGLFLSSDILKNRPARDSTPGVFSLEFFEKFRNNYFWNISKQLCISQNNEILPNVLVWKFCGKAQVCAEFRANCSKLCENYAFPQNFNSRKLDEILIFYAMTILSF